MGTGATVALNLLFGLLDRAQAVGALISKAQAEGRDVSDTELDALAASDDAARAALVQAIKDARKP
ncbi:MAG: hypothetical protein NUV34_03320 [Sulfuricaulis sp.]|nr:hypothetical protein [Sulfuricaulis sp.]